MNAIIIYGEHALDIIGKIRKKVNQKEYEFTIPHFFEEMANDNLDFMDVKRVIATGAIRRKFMHDPRGVRYEIVGRAVDGRKIAVICRIKSTGMLLFITVYAL